MTKRVAKPIEQELEDEIEDAELDEESYEDEDEEYEEYEERSRLVPIAVVSIALALFVALGWYAYRASTSPAAEDLLTVEAEQTPIKERPLDEGGMQFPNQDKSVYETIGDNNPTPTAEVVDNTETPMNIAEAPVSSAETVTAQASVVTPSEESVAQPVAEEAPSSAPVTATEQALAAPVAETPLVKEQVPAAPVVQKTETIAEVAKPAAVKKAEAPKAAAPTVKASSGTQSVQLGAFKSEAEAQAAWKKLSSNPAVSGKSHTVQKADLGDKGIFYRLRVSGVDAAKTCAQLAGKSPCMAVK